MKKRILIFSELFKQAVDAGDTTAMFNLALLYLDTGAGYYEPARAAALLKKCALDGFAEARELLTELHSQEGASA